MCTSTAVVLSTEDVERIRQIFICQTEATPSWREDRDNEIPQGLECFTFPHKSGKPSQCDCDKAKAALGFSSYACVTGGTCIVRQTLNDFD